MVTVGGLLAQPIATPFPVENHSAPSFFLFLVVAFPSSSHGLVAGACVHGMAQQPHLAWPTTLMTIKQQLPPGSKGLRKLKL